MHIVFRTDASLQIGTGHVMRCLTLADALRERGGQSTFICRPHPGHLLDLIRQHGHTATELAPADGTFTAPADLQHAEWLGTDWASDAEQTRQALCDSLVDWLVVDHYALDRRWEQALRPHTRRILAIDDLADRPHDSDLLLDQNLGRQAQDYGGLLSPHTQTLIGPTYALLRPEFAQWREHSLQRRRNPQMKNLLISMGGVDQANVTGQVLAALTRCNLPVDLRITVVMGPTAPWFAQVQDQAAALPHPTQVLAGVNNMAELMTESDLCIGAAGSTSWERCCLGLPTIQLVLAANQKEAALALTEIGAALSISVSTQFTTDLQLLIDEIDFQQMKTLTDQSACICNGRGHDAVITQLMMH
jgi:UDP-2,4-diacetamido-2,4,6-trideoxy-beta-L-altropyranose hydrolase